MVYFLGRDVKVYLNAETTGSSQNIGVDGSEQCEVAAVPASSLFAPILESTALSGYNALTDITGVDIGMGATDEDFSYVGQRTSGRIEVKKEMTVTLTRKKSNNNWDIIYNGPTEEGSATNTSYLKQGARWGLDGSGLLLNGLTNPKDAIDGNSKVNAGYRISVQTKSGASGEVITIPSLFITGHSVTLNADGTTEETMEFSSQQSLLFGSDGDNMNVTLIAQADF